MVVDLGWKGSTNQRRLWAQSIGEWTRLSLGLHIHTHIYSECHRVLGLCVSLFSAHSAAECNPRLCVVLANLN